MSTVFQENISSDEVTQLPAGQFKGEIIVVDSEEDIAKACQYLIKHETLGFDTETRPSFKAGQINKVALLQLSTNERCFLFRLCTMKFDKEIIKIIENTKIRKIGADIKGDLNALAKLRHFKPGGFVDLQNIIADWGIAEKSVRKMAALTLGVRVSKAQRLSNWEAATLTPAQQLYAATDAWVCLEIFDKLEKTPKPKTPINKAGHGREDVQTKSAPVARDTAGK